tara:strand:+ start:4526 stop:5389 length:864 start_codon:yes stop_codon:yes gene_type:complete
MDVSDKIEKLENNFKNILSLDRKIESEKGKLKEKLVHLKDTHGKMSKSNSKQIFLFCLDSFFFQYKLFSMEHDNLSKFSLLIKNRIYCDYYKLYKLILKYLKDHEEELQIHISHSLVPSYKDLEPYFDYGIENITLVHENMLDCIKKMFQNVIEKENTIEDYTTKKKAGYSISNFVNTMSHENNILKAQIDLYLNYISFFHISQKRQIKRLFQKFDEFDTEIVGNISTEKAFSFESLHEDELTEEEIELVQDVIPGHEIESETETSVANELKVDENKEISEFTSFEN